MTNPRKQDRGLALLKRLLRVHAVGWTITRKLIEVFEVDPPDDVAGALMNLLGSEATDLADRYRQPIVDHGGMAVVWGGRPCRLGNTLLLRLMERLARRPNQYIPFERLVREVWDSHAVSDEAIRNAVYRLKQALRAAGLSDLAVRIRSAGRSYGLFLDGEPM